MSDELVRILHYSVDLRKPVEKTELHELFVMGDSLAHRIELEITRGGEDVSLSGCTVTGYFTNFAEDTTVKVDGEVKNGKASVTISKPCYSIHGQFVLTIQISGGGVDASVFCGDGFMRASKTETIIYDDYVIYDVSTLLSQIASMKNATKDAQDAAGAANTAAGSANTAAGKADEKASAADIAAKGASGWANATMTATALASGSAPTANVTTASDGHKVITVGIPRGNTGATPQISVEVSTGSAGSDASVSVSGTAENPIIHLTIPRGDTGAIENLTINGKPVESGTITMTASDVGARPDTWMPSASDVGARPNTWMPSASDVGARPNTWMPSASDVGARALDAAISHEYTATLTAAGWTGDAAPYTQTVDISGILAADSPIADLDVSGATADSYGALAAAWACVGRITTQDGQITATCFETRPTVDMTVRLMAVR